MKYENAFEALGFEVDEATVEVLRADLAGIVRDWISQCQLTQAAAGRRLGIPQSAVSEILAGRTGKKSIEYFVKLLARAGIPWTARCWHAPSDAAAVEGRAPMSWVDTGRTGRQYEQPVLTAGAYYLCSGNWGIATVATGTQKLPGGHVVHEEIVGG